MPVTIFFCYAHEDELLLNKLKAQLSPLKRRNLIDTWYDRDINAGTEWEHEINQHLNTAQIILLLVSPDFMNSDYCYGIEMQRALERHERKEAVVIPIILRHVYWQEEFGKLQALPTDAKPVTDRHWHTIDEAFYDVVSGIRKAIEKVRIAHPVINVSPQIVQVRGGVEKAEVHIPLQTSEGREAVEMPSSTKRRFPLFRNKQESNGDQFYKFTIHAKLVLSFALEEAQRFENNYIGTEHLLLGLIRDSDGMAAKVLADLDVKWNKVRNATEFIIARSSFNSALGEIGLTPRAKNVIELAVDEALRLNHQYIGTEHILLGLIREGEGIAAGVLDSLGVNLDNARRQTVLTLKQNVREE